MVLFYGDAAFSHELHMKTILGYAAFCKLVIVVDRSAEVPPLFAPRAVMDLIWMVQAHAHAAGYHNVEYVPYFG